jgi:hypothetical protein
MAARSIDIMKKFTKTYKIFIVVILVLVATASTVLGVKAYSNYQDEKSINSSLSNISQIDKKFDSETDRAKKLTILENIEKGFTSYKKSRKVFSKVSSKYTSEISKMKKYFTDGYGEAVDKNTISDVSTINDKTVLSTYISNLQNEEKIISNEANYVCNSNQVNTYNSKINATIDSYNAKIKAIEDAEAKAAAEAKAEADAKAAADEKAKQEAATSSKSGSSSTSSKAASSTSSEEEDWTKHEFLWNPLNNPNTPEPAYGTVVEGEDIAAYKINGQYYAYAGSYWKWRVMAVIWTWSKVTDSDNVNDGKWLLPVFSLAGTSPSPKDFEALSFMNKSLTPPAAKGTYWGEPYYKGDGMLHPECSVYLGDGKDPQYSAHW